MPGADPGVRRIPTTIIAKALAWQRNRSRNSKDSYFDEFVEEFVNGMEKEMPELNDGKQTPTFPAGNHTIDENRRLGFNLLFPSCYSDNISPYCKISFGASCMP